MTEIDAQTRAFMEHVSREVSKLGLDLLADCEKQPDPEIATNLVLAALIQIVRAYLAPRPPKQRAQFLRVLHTEGLEPPKETLQ